MGFTLVERFPSSPRALPTEHNQINKTFRNNANSTNVAYNIDHPGAYVTLIRTPVYPSRFNAVTTADRTLKRPRGRAFGETYPNAR